MIHTFLFDMGNVLVHFSHDRMCAQIGALCERSAAEIRQVLFDSGLQHDFERGRLTETEFHRLFQQAVQREIDFAGLTRAGADIFWANEPMPKLLDQLKALGHRLVLLSNTSVTHFEWIWEQYDVLQKFDDFVTSYRVGAIKPEAAIFEAALEKIGCEPAECFYTDDIAEYVEIGRSYGWQAEQFIDAKTLAGQLQDQGVSIEVS